MYPESESLIDLIKEKSSRDQSKTSVKLHVTTANVYSPHKLGSEDFSDYSSWLHTLEIIPENYSICPKIWGKFYDNGEQTCNPHNHPEYEWAVIHYLSVDKDCGMLGVENELIEPKDNMMVVMSGDCVHYVLPADEPEAKRVLMVFNLIKKA